MAAGVLEKRLSGKSMRCLSCQYDLRNLTSGGGADASDDGGVHRCPECGRIFDAADPQTFDTGPNYLAWLAILAVTIVLSVSAALLAVWLRRMLF